MSQLIPRVHSRQTNWNQNSRFRVGEGVTHLNSSWVNITGFNTEPSLSSTDWLYVRSSAPNIITFNVSSDTSEFTLPSAVLSLDFYVDGRKLIQTSQYTLVGNLITTANEVRSGSIVEIRTY